MIVFLITVNWFPLIMRDICVKSLKKNRNYYVTFSVLHGEVELRKFFLGEDIIKEFKQNIIVNENKNIELD